MGYSGLYWVALSCTGLHRVVTDCTRLYWAEQDLIGLHLPVLDSSGEHWDSTLGQHCASRCCDASALLVQYSGAILGAVMVQCAGQYLVQCGGSTGAVLWGSMGQLWGQYWGIIGAS